MIACDDAELLIAAHAVGSLDPDEAAALRAHLAICTECRRSVSAYAAAASVLPLTVERVDPPPALRSRLLATVYAEAAAGRHLAPPAPGVPWYRRAWAALPTGRGFTLAAAAAAAAAIALTGWGIERGAAPAPAPERTLSVRFDGTAVASQARCVLFYDPETQTGVLRVDGLARPQVAASGGAGTYEVWLLRSDHSVTGSAFLTLQPDGHTWMAALPADLTHYSGVAATVEPPGGSAAPSGPMVLRATFDWRNATS